MLANDIRYDTPLYIRELQSALRDIHFMYPDEIPLINIDGIFGPETTEVVLAAQRLGGREATGIVDYETWMWLFAVRRSGIRSANTVTVLGKVISLDNENEVSKAVKTMLIALSGTFSNLSASSNDASLASILGEFAVLAQINDTQSSYAETIRLLTRLYAVYAS